MFNTIKATLANTKMKINEINLDNEKYKTKGDCEKENHAEECRKVFEGIDLNNPPAYMKYSTLYKKLAKEAGISLCSGSSESESMEANVNINNIKWSDNTVAELANYIANCNIINAGEEELIPIINMIRKIVSDNDLQRIDIDDYIGIINIIKNSMTVNECKNAVCKIVTILYNNNINDIFKLFEYIKENESIFSEIISKSKEDEENTTNQQPLIFDVESMNKAFASPMASPSVV